VNSASSSAARRRRQQAWRDAREITTVSAAAMRGQRIERAVPPATAVQVVGTITPCGVGRGQR
jgi:hypothetical protein